MDAARIILGEVDSTMAEAARRAPELGGPTWILARRQTAAKGRRGRPWRHGAHNFAATLVMDAAVEDAALRSFTAALAVHDALSALGAAPLSLKWPNDVLLGGRKVSGILLEALPKSRLAIGIGINLVAPPSAESLEPDALAPAALDADVALEDLLDRLAHAFADWEARYLAEGFEPLRAAWLSRAARLGEPIRARLPHTEHKGVFETIDKEGRLVLSTADGPLTISAADIFF